MNKKTSLAAALKRRGFGGTLGFLIVYAAAAGLLVPGFFSAVNLINIFKSVSVMGVMACGVTFVMLTGNIDLSCSALMSLTACISCALIDVSPVLALAVPLLAGAAFGLLNGLLVGGLRLNSFVATLGLNSIYQALTFFYTKGHYYSSTYTGWYRQLGQGSLLGIPVLALIFVASVCLCAFVQRHSVFGAQLYAVGGNPISARFSGVRSTWMTVSVYSISGFFSALSGVMLCSRSMAAQPKMGQGYEFEVLIAVLIGGLSMSSGRGSAWGTLLGVMLIGVIENSFALMRLGIEAQYIAEGLLLFIAIAIQVLSERRESR